MEKASWVSLSEQHPSLFITIFLAPLFQNELPCPFSSSKGFDFSSRVKCILLGSFSFAKDRRNIWKWSQETLRQQDCRFLSNGTQMNSIVSVRWLWDSMKPVSANPNISVCPKICHQENTRFGTSNPAAVCPLDSMKLAGLCGLIPSKKCQGHCLLLQHPSPACANQHSLLCVSLYPKGWTPLHKCHSSSTSLSVWSTLVSCLGLWIGFGLFVCFLKSCSHFQVSMEAT